MRRDASRRGAGTRAASGLLGGGSAVVMLVACGGPQSTPRELPRAAARSDPSPSAPPSDAGARRPGLVLEKILPAAVRTESTLCHLEGDDVVARFFSEDDEYAVDHAVIEVGSHRSWAVVTKGGITLEGPIANRRVDVRLKRAVTVGPGFRALGATLSAPASAENVATLRRSVAPVVKAHGTEPSFSCTDVVLMTTRDAVPAAPAAVPTPAGASRASEPPPVPRVPHVGMPTRLTTSPTSPTSPGASAIGEVQRCAPVHVLEKRGAHVRVRFLDRLVDVTGWVPDVAVTSLSIETVPTRELDGRCEPRASGQPHGRFANRGLTDDDLRLRSSFGLTDDDLRSAFGPGGLGMSGRPSSSDLNETGAYDSAAVTIAAHDPSRAATTWTCLEAVPLYRRTPQGLVPIGKGHGALHVERGEKKLRDVYDVPAGLVVRADDLRGCTTR